MQISYTRRELEYQCFLKVQIFIKPLKTTDAHTNPDPE